jgi:hypothetical protein
MRNCHKESKTNVVFAGVVVVEYVYEIIEFGSQGTLVARISLLLADCAPRDIVASA